MSNKRDLVLSIIGSGFKCITTAQNMERLGYAEFCGHQHNPEWKWKKEKLEALSENELLTLFEINYKEPK